MDRQEEIVVWVKTSNARYGGFQVGMASERVKRSLASHGLQAK